MRLLLIEDEEKLASSIKKGLEEEGFLVVVQKDGKKAEKYIKTFHEIIDLIILDLALPSEDGIEICKEIRSQNISTPVLIITARDSEQGIITGLEAGADDYITKPFSFLVFIARVKALLRRPPKSFEEKKLRVGNLVLDSFNRKILIKGNEISFTLKEFNLLEYLIRHPNEVVEREQLLERVWDVNYDSFSNVVDVHVKNIRKKLKEVGNEKLLETVRGVGFRIKG